MIYTIFEYLATISESVILCLFLVRSFGYREITVSSQILGTLFFFVLIVCNALMWDKINILFNYETIHSILYCVLLFLFAHNMLNGKWHEHALCTLLFIISVFLINITIVSISGIVLENEYSEILLMRNPARIFLLIISKVALYCLLDAISNIIIKKECLLYAWQSIGTALMVLLSIITGTTIEKMLLDDVLPMKYAAIIMTCMSFITILLIIIIGMMGKRNSIEQRNLAIKIKLQEEQVRVKELIQWSTSVKTLRHDMKNHLIAIKKYADSNDISNLQQYLEKMQGSLKSTFDYYDTNNPLLDAIINAKKSICIRENIDLKCYLDENIPIFDEYLFNSFFSNLFDNAIEAELNEDNKQIKLSITKESGSVIIIIQNSISHNILTDKSLPETSKEDKENHGLGLQSVYTSVSKLNGMIDLYENESWFVAEVVLPCR